MSAYYPSFGGVISDLPESEVDKVLALYHSACLGGGYSSSSGGYSSNEPNVNIVCKEPREYAPPPTEKKVIRLPPPESKKQVIFVEVNSNDIFTIF